MNGLPEAGRHLDSFFHELGINTNDIVDIIPFAMNNTYIYASPKRSHVGRCEPDSYTARSWSV